MEALEKHGVSFVSVTQQFNTTSSMGRLTLNILLSFAQFEREIISERTRDKIAAARRKGKWSGGRPILGFDVDPRGGRLIVNEDEATRVRAIYDTASGEKTLKKLYIGNLPFSATEDEIRETFGAHGEVHSIALINDREPGRPRGFGFIEMDDELPSRPCRRSTARKRAVAR